MHSSRCTPRSIRVERCDCIPIQNEASANRKSERADIPNQSDQSALSASLTVLSFLPVCGELSGNPRSNEGGDISRRKYDQGRHNGTLGRAEEEIERFRLVVE